MVVAVEEPPALLARRALDFPGLVNLLLRWRRLDFEGVEHLAGVQTAVLPSHLQAEEGEEPVGNVSVDGQPAEAAKALNPPVRGATGDDFTQQAVVVDRAEHEVPDLEMRSLSNRVCLRETSSGA